MARAITLPRETLYKLIKQHGSMSVAELCAHEEVRKFITDPNEVMLSNYLWELVRQGEVTPVVMGTLAPHCSKDRFSVATSH